MTLHAILEKLKPGINQNFVKDEIARFACYADVGRRFNRLPEEEGRAVDRLIILNPELYDFAGKEIGYIMRRNQFKRKLNYELLTPTNGGMHGMRLSYYEKTLFTEEFLTFQLNENGITGDCE